MVSWDYQEKTGVKYGGKGWIDIHYSGGYIGCYTPEPCKKTATPIKLFRIYLRQSIVKDWLN